MTLSAPMKLIIAKSSREDGRWLPLWVHAADTANVTEELLRIRYAALGETCGIPFDELKKTAILLAYLHDIGKITPLFQLRILQSLPGRRSVFEHYGVEIADHFLHGEDSHHTKCGEAILLNHDFPKGFSAIVGAHHGMPSEGVGRHISRYPNHFYGKPKQPEFWEGLYHEWENFSLERAGFSSVSEIPVLNQRTQILLSGLLVTADWLASDQTNFELIAEDLIPSENEYPNDRPENALERIGLTGVWESFQRRFTDADFAERFSFSMNEIQKTVLDTTANCRSPGLMILEAPMGIGKTEAALAAAEILAEKCEKTGVFFGLPTQATTNGIFERVLRWAELHSVDDFHSINLAHGNAEFQSDFMNIPKSIPPIDTDGDSGIIAHSFFGGRKRALLADFVVGTVDRLLMCALKKKHAMLLHLGISSKVVIVDEAHAYDAYMNRYLDRALAWLHRYNVPVILLSATLPPDRREALIRTYLPDGSDQSIPTETAYPRLTYTDGEKIRSVSLPLTIPNKTVHIRRDDDDSATAEIARAVNAGACVGIICNTVARAQHFAKLSQKIEKATVILYHAQFIIPDRIEKEEALKNAVGKNSTNAERSGTVVIGTQVLEQSLDIDFDLLITDLCPMDLLLQRIGRLHRHERSDRPQEFKNAECIVLGTDEPISASEKIYTKWLLTRTKTRLPDEINVPGDIDKLVCETYKDVEPNGEEEKSALEDYRFLISKKAQKAEGYLMPRPRDSRYGNDLYDWLKNSVSDHENNALAAVRDGISSIEVIILVKRPDGGLTLLPWQSDGSVYSPAVCPPEEDCKKIAQQKLRLPSAFSWDADKTIEAIEKTDKHLTGFQKSHWLKGELVLLLDETLSADLCGFRITYSREGGLYYDNLTART